MDATRDEGGADPIGQYTTAALLVEIAQKSADIACARQKGGGASVWIRWAVEIVIVIVGVVWGISLLFAARPTTDRVETMIKTSHSDHPQHPESKIQIQQNVAAIHATREKMAAIEEGVAAIKKTVDEIKVEVKKGRK